jgi:hypothetical protein
MKSPHITCHVYNYWLRKIVSLYLFFILSTLCFPHPIVIFYLYIFEILIDFIFLEILFLLIALMPLGRWSPFGTKKDNKS